MGQKSNGEGNGSKDGADFTLKGKPVDRVRVDHETGMMHVPGVGPLPLVGPTSGKEYQNLQEAEERFNQDRAKLVELMRRKWRCTQCKKTWPGTRVRVKKAGGGVEEVVFVCADLKCDAPVVMVAEEGKGK